MLSGQYKEGLEMAKKMILVDGSKCTGCKACSAACKEWNDLPTEKTSLVKSYQSMADFTPNTYTYVTFEEKYENNNMHWLMRKAQCFHCDDPSCLKACSSSAISKTDSGFVVIDQDKCIGCGYCAQFCPFHVPKIDKTTEKANKCTGCVGRVENGLEPACVKICQPGALSFGDYDTMLGIAQARLAEVKKKFPNANLYGQNGQSGTTYRYILLDTPAAYGLPENPSTDLTLYLWKDIIRPIGKIAIGGAAAAVVVGVAINALKGNYKKDSDQDQHPIKREEEM
jgi:Fe-S-cluster-containing hydrogenase components 1